MARAVAVAEVVVGAAVLLIGGVLPGVVLALLVVVAQSADREHVALMADPAPRHVPRVLSTQAGVLGSHGLAGKLVPRANEVLATVQVAA